MYALIYCSLSRYPQQSASPICTIVSSPEFKCILHGSQRDMCRTFTEVSPVIGWWQAETYVARILLNASLISTVTDMPPVQVYASINVNGLLVCVYS